MGLRQPTFRDVRNGDTIRVSSDSWTLCNQWLPNDEQDYTHPEALGKYYEVVIASGESSAQYSRISFNHTGVNRIIRGKWCSEGHYMRVVAPLEGGYSIMISSAVEKLYYDSQNSLAKQLLLLRTRPDRDLPLQGQRPQGSCQLPYNLRRLRGLSLASSSATDFAMDQGSRRRLL